MSMVLECHDSPMPFAHLPPVRRGAILPELVRTYPVVESNFACSSSNDQPLQLPSHDEPVANAMRPATCCSFPDCQKDLLKMKWEEPLTNLVWHHGANAVPSRSYEGFSVQIPPASSRPGHVLFEHHWTPRTLAQRTKRLWCHHR